MEYQDETVFVNYEKLDQRQNRQNRDGRVNRWRAGRTVRHPENWIRPT